METFFQFKIIGTTYSTRGYISDSRQEIQEDNAVPEEMQPINVDAKGDKHTEKDVSDPGWYLDLEKKKSRELFKWMKLIKYKHFY